MIPEDSVCSELLTAMDMLPTLADLARTSLPGDRAIDGEDIGETLADPEGATSPHEYYSGC